MSASEQPTAARGREERVGARLVTRGGLGFAVVLIPGLRFGWRGLAAALVAGVLAATTVLVQRAAIARARRGLAAARAAAAASAAAGLLAVAGIVQVAVLLAARGAGPEAQVASIAQLLSRHSADELALRAVALVGAGIVLGGPLGAATLLELQAEGRAEPGAPARWLFRSVGLATGLLVASCAAVALRMQPFDPVLPLGLLLVAVVVPTACTLLVVVPVALLEGVLYELVLTIGARRGRG